MLICFNAIVPLSQISFTGSASQMFKGGLALSRVMDQCHPRSNFTSLFGHFWHDLGLDQTNSSRSLSTHHEMFDLFQSSALAPS